MNSELPHSIKKDISIICASLSKVFTQESELVIARMLFYWVAGNVLYIFSKKPAFSNRLPVKGSINSHGQTKKF
jgi:hypothetical protein